jgi:uncharacterized protein involved in exopolysaccharide biosynthesis
MSEQQDHDPLREQYPSEDPPAVPLPWILAVLLRERRLIAAFTAIGLVLAIALALLKGPTYTSTFSFLPQSGEDQGRLGLASLAGQFGISVGGLGGGSQHPQLYADLLVTRGVLATIARDSVTDGQRRVPLAEFLRIKGESAPVVLENTIRTLRQQVVTTSVASHTTNVVTVSSRTRSPQASLEIAQKLLDGVNRFNVETRKSQAASERRFTEGRLEAEKAALRLAEDALQRFLQGNRQFGNASELAFQRDRLQREVNLHQQIVQGLSQQYEDARIREVRDTPVITIIEQPTLPVIQDSSGRLLNTIILTIVAGFLGAVFAIAREGWDRQRRGSESDPSYGLLEGEWRNLRETFKKS